MRNIIRYVIWLYVFAFSLSCSAQTMPQDNWFDAKVLDLSQHLTRWTDGFTLVETNRFWTHMYDGGFSRELLEFDEDGTVYRRWSVPGATGGPLIGTNQLIYALADRIRGYDFDGNVVVESATGYFNRPTEFTIYNGNRLITADDRTHSIRIFDLQLNLLTSWSESPNDVRGNFVDGPEWVAVGPDGLLYASDENKIKVYDLDGNYIREFEIWVPNGTQRNYLESHYTIGPDGRLYAFEFNGGLRIYDTAGNLIQLVKLVHPEATVAGGGAVDIRDLQFHEDGRMFVRWGESGREGMMTLERGYRTMSANPGNSIPVPVASNLTQRIGTTLIELDYRVLDIDDAIVHTGGLAFLDNQNDLNAVIPMRTFVEGTATNIGAGISVGDNQHLTWDIVTDFSTNLVNFSVEILAKDTRDLLGFHYLTLPASGTNGVLTISRSPLTQEEMLSAWYWLIAVDDPGISFANGVMTAVGGAQDGLVLAQNTSTTGDGEAWLLSRLNVRKASASEILRAREGSLPGSVNQFDPRAQIGAHPEKINEYGFDTGDNWPADSVFVVPLP